MSGFSFSFNSETQEIKGFDPLPAGVYNVLFTNAELKDSKSGGGAYLKIEFEVCDAKYAGRKLWEMFNVVHSNPEVVEIAKQQLAQMLKASGRTLKFDGDVTKLDAALNETMHDAAMCARVTIDKGSEEYEPSNRIRSFQPEKTQVSPNKGGWSPRQ